jgi:nitroreductase
MIANKEIDITYPVSDLIARRWSPRSFADRPIAADTLGSLLEAARWAPSSRNEQPWRFIVARRHAEPEAFRRLFGVLKEGNQRWAGNAGALLMAVARTTYARNDAPNGHARHDLGQAIAYLTLEAMRHDLYLRQMGGFYADKAIEALGIEPPFEPVTAIAVGYLGAPDALPDVLQERETGPRTARRPLHEIAFSGRFGNPLILR